MSPPLMCRTFATSPGTRQATSSASKDPRASTYHVDHALRPSTSSRASSVSSSQAMSYTNASTPRTGGLGFNIEHKSSITITITTTTPVNPIILTISITQRPHCPSLPALAVLPVCRWALEVQWKAPLHLKASARRAHSGRSATYATKVTHWSTRVSASRAVAPKSGR